MSMRMCSMLCLLLSSFDIFCVRFDWEMVRKKVCWHKTRHVLVQWNQHKSDFGWIVHTISTYLSSHFASASQARGPWFESRWEHSSFSLTSPNFVPVAPRVAISGMGQARIENNLCIYLFITPISLVCASCIPPIVPLVSVPRRTLQLLNRALFLLFGGTNSSLTVPNCFD